MKLGVFGGTFDPVHQAHLVLAEQAREQLGLERVLWVPARDPWRKAGRPVSAPEHRLAMLRLALAGQPAFELSTVELDRARPSYSVETLSELRAGMAGAELFLVLGQDALEDLPRWREPERIIQLAALAVAGRGGPRPSAGDLEALLPGLANRIVWVEMPRLDISASDLRRRAAEGRSLRYLLPDAVRTYIAEHGLYRHP